MTDVARRVRGSCAVALVLLAFAACKGEEQGPNGELKLHGTVHMVQSPDGATCWKFTSTKGNDYELQPAQVPQALLVDGATAVLLAKARKDAGSFCKVGTVVDVVSADSIAAGSGGTTAGT